MHIIHNDLVSILFSCKICEKCIKILHYCLPTVYCISFRVFCTFNSLPLHSAYCFFVTYAALLVSSYIGLLWVDFFFALLCLDSRVNYIFSLDYEIISAIVALLEVWVMRVFFLNFTNFVALNVCSVWF